jgi:hypothetical protein
MTEGTALDNFTEHLEEMVDWIIYDDPDKKFVENFLVVPPSKLYSKCVPICNKQVYITLKDVRWPEAKLTCFNENIENLEAVCSFDKHNHAQILCSKSIEYIINPRDRTTMDPEKLIPLEKGFEYEGDYYVEEEDIPSYGFKVPETGFSEDELFVDDDYDGTVYTYPVVPSSDAGEEGAEPKPVIYYRVIAKKIFTMVFDCRFGTRIGSVTTGIHTGDHSLRVTYLARPDQMDK